MFESINNSVLKEFLTSIRKTDLWLVMQSSQRKNVNRCNELAEIVNATAIKIVSVADTFGSVYFFPCTRFSETKTKLTQVRRTGRHKESIFLGILLRNCIHKEGAVNRSSLLHVHERSSNSLFFL